MKYKSGVIRLGALYDYAHENSECYLPPRSPDAKSRLRVYANHCRALTNQIPEKRGVYLWGRYDKKGLWMNIYLGFAGEGKTACLRARINEELRDEKSCVWADVIDERKIKAIGGKGHKARLRALRKAGATHIVWVATPGLENKDVHDVESDLIEALNPTANLSRPSPPYHLQMNSGKIFRMLRRIIHHNRPQ